MYYFLCPMKDVILFFFKEQISDTMKKHLTS
jgi:hypothetical protein